MISLLKQFLYIVKECALHFVNQNCLRMATALSYQSLLAVVPLAVMAVSLLTYLDAFYTFQEDIVFFLFDNLLPTTITSAYDILQDIVVNAKELTYLGFVGLALAAILLFLNIEGCFRQIWRSTTSRNVFIRLFAYLLMLAAGPIALASSLTLVKWLSNWTEQASGISFDQYVEYFNFMVPFLVTLSILFLLYRLVPTRKVSALHALIGASIAASLFVLSKTAFKLYLLAFPTYEAIYGALAILPLFLIWIYLCWILVLLGATITAVLGFNYSEQLSPLNAAEKREARKRVTE
ncbi:YihY family inner membrane protein [Sneathiella limimaris]|uniref:YihY family inner membrane protein n=1 Tax=Sneathiella limimaris TaxID=1964213 RepID=UPI00146A49D6|nr:YihY family inner membrane protein [Sneathiella limimaris]